MKKSELPVLNTEIIGSLIGGAVRLKLALADRAVERLPESVRPAVEELKAAVLDGIYGQLSQYLDKSRGHDGEKGLKRVEIEEG